ncbi:MAG TPA: host attachment family protein [Sphingomonadaceae bacterium]|nr:host attachment family protein [Sphingomonadaceae bacterium]
MKIVHGTLVMAADGRKMLLFRNDGDEKYAILDTLDHEEEQAPPTHLLGSDAPGRTQSSLGNRRSAYGDTDWHEQAEERFAIESARRLEEAALREGGPIVVLAPPRTLGILRQHWGRETRVRLIAEIGKDVVHRGWEVIARTIGDYQE